VRPWRRTWRDAVGVRLASLAAGVAVFGLWSEYLAVGAADWRSWLPDAAVGLTLLVSGLIAYREAARVGLLLIATSAAWWLGNVVPEGVFLHRGLLLLSIWAYPEVRIGARSTGCAIVAGGLVSLPVLARSDAGTVCFGVLLLTGSVVRFAVSGPGDRRCRRIALRAAMVVALGAVGAAVLRHEQILDADLPTTWYQIAVAAGGATLALGVLRQPTDDIVDAVIELAADPGTPLRDRLADLLDDPELVVAHRVGDEWVDDGGTPVDTSADASRTVAILPGGEIALVHDAAVARDPALFDALESGTRLATRNAELAIATQRVLDELVASSQRLHDVEREERARLSSRLHRGVGRRLDAVGAHLATAAASAQDPTVADGIRSATDQLRRTRSDLLLIAQGLHPEGHTTLLDSLTSLVAGLPIQAELRTPEQEIVGLGPEISVALSYCCSEALSNAVKHAFADRIVVELSIDESDVVLAVIDDGVGGADPVGGSGLSGLRDRALALGGGLHVNSPPGAGTQLTVTLPHRAAQLPTAAEVPA
jgi:signal transduction histidine kinase